MHNFLILSWKYYVGGSYPTVVPLIKDRLSAFHFMDPPLDKNRYSGSIFLHHIFFALRSVIYRHKLLQNQKHNICTWILCGSVRDRVSRLSLSQEYHRYEKWLYFSHCPIVEQNTSDMQINCIPNSNSTWKLNL